MGQESNSLTVALQVRASLRVRASAAVTLWLTQFHKVFPGQLLNEPLQFEPEKSRGDDGAWQIALGSNLIDRRLGRIDGVIDAALSSERGGNGRTAASGDGFVSGKRICRSSRMSAASMISFAPCWMSRFDPIALGALMCPGTA